jgi:hypothetical protein
MEIPGSVNTWFSQFSVVRLRSVTALQSQAFQTKNNNKINRKIT